MTVKLSTVLVLLCMVSIQCINCDYIVKGKIIFEGEAPRKFPKGTKLTVKVEDTSMMDAPSKILNSTETIITGYKKEEGLTYSVTIDHAVIPNGINSIPDISVSLFYRKIRLFF